MQRFDSSGLHRSEAKKYESDNDPANKTDRYDYGEDKDDFLNK